MATSLKIAAEILRLYHVEKLRVEAIARQLQVHRSVVYRVVRQAGSPHIATGRPSIIDPFLPIICQTLNQFPTIAASRLHIMVKKLGYEGAVDHFRHLISYYRPPSTHHRPPARENVAMVNEGEPPKHRPRGANAIASTQISSHRRAPSVYALRIEISTHFHPPKVQEPTFQTNARVSGTATADHDWQCEFTVHGRHSLEQLNEVLLQLLGLNLDCLYEFRIADRVHAHLVRLEEDTLFIQTETQCVSCDIPIRHLGLSVGDSFEWTFNFSECPIFCITVLDVRPVTATEVVPAVLSSHGKIMVHLQDYSRASKSDAATSQPTVGPPTRGLDPFRVRYIREADGILLRQWRASNSKTNWEKSVAVLESRNMPTIRIAEKIEQSQGNVEQWIVAFNRYGLDGLRKPHGRREPSNTSRQEKSKAAKRLKATRILQIFHSKPSAYGINRSNWNRESIAKVYEQEHKEPISDRYAAALLQEFGYAIRKARKVLTSPDPNYREKVDLLLKTLQSLNANELFFFIDELGPLRVKRYGGRALVRKNEVLTYPQEQAHRGVIMMSGALSATTNQVTWVYGRAKDTAAMIDLMELLYNQYFSAPKLYVTWDAASWHKSAMLVEWLDAFNATTKKANEGPLIELVPLPTSSQFLNVIEAIFSGMKRAVVHHSDYRDVPEMKKAISLHFTERNAHFRENPRRAGKKIWEIDFFDDNENIRSGNYREW